MIDWLLRPARGPAGDPVVQVGAQALPLDIRRRAQARRLTMRLAPDALDYMIPSHLSFEPGAKLLREITGLEPMLNMDMRLGEGTGAVAVMPLLDMALAVYNDLMTFADIGM